MLNLLELFQFVIIFLTYLLDVVFCGCEQISRGGGRGIVVQCDHKNQDDVTKLFDRVKQENNGRLDLLVNNAYSAVTVRWVLVLLLGKFNFLIHVLIPLYNYFYKINRSNSIIYIKHD